jgi:hypothetical protein
MCFTILMTILDVLNIAKNDSGKLNIIMNISLVLETPFFPFSDL